MEIPLLKDLIIIFGLAFGVILICHRLRVPSIVGLLLTGVLAGPHGLGLIQQVHEVEILAEVGVVLLLFAIGLEFTLDNLLKMKKTVLLAGSLQVSLTALVVFIITSGFRGYSAQSLFYGFLIAFSSTAIVLKLLAERAEVDSPHGKIILGILIFQDLAVVPLMLLTPLLSREGSGLLYPFLKTLALATIVVGVTLFLSRRLVPWLLYQAARLRERELFLLAVVFLGLGIAWLTSEVGLSLALGAFLAGLVISDSEYSRAALGNIIPFRDVFTSLFFVSIGMLLDLGFFITHPLLILLLALSVLFLKALIAGGTTLVMGLPLRTASLVGAALCQIGEFSFLLALVGLKEGIIKNQDYQVVLSVAVLTMIAAPFIIGAGNKLSEAAMRAPLPERLKKGWRYEPETKEPTTLSDHLVIVGFGPGGRSLAAAARALNLSYIIIEMNPETVRKERRKGEPIFFGDAGQAEVLKHAKVENARILVINISDMAATRRIVEEAKKLNRALHIIVRTPYLKEIEPLLKLGADEVISAEFETAIEIITRVMRKYLVPQEKIHRFITELRKKGYEMFQKPLEVQPGVFDLREYLQDIEIITVKVGERSPAAGKTIGEIGLRKNYEVTVLAIRRGEQIISNPDADEKFHPGDLVVLMGRPEKIKSASEIFVAMPIEE